MTRNVKPIVLEVFSSYSYDESGFKEIIKKGDSSGQDESKKFFREVDGMPRKTQITNLGIYIKSKKEFEYKTDRLVGIMHLRENKGEIAKIEGKPLNNYLCVTPRWGDSVTMLETVLESDDISDDTVYRLLTPKVKRWDEWQKYEKEETINGKDSDFLYGVISDEPEIEIKFDGQDDKQSYPQMVANIQNFFEIHEYMNQLEIICKRVLKQQSLPTEENLSCKVKGRININKQIKYNLSKGRLDRNYCVYNKMSIDNLENRILKYALYICKTWSHQHGDFLSDKILYCDNILKSVKLTKITNADIHSVKVNGAFKDYKKGIDLAKRIISKTAFSFDGMNDNSEKQVQTKKVKPFFIRMDLLFELYCRALLREVIKDKTVWNETGMKMEMEDYSENEIELFDIDETQMYPMGFQQKHIADILIKGNDVPKYVIDAKYSMLADGYSDRIRGNTHQILAYMLLFHVNSGGFIYPIDFDGNVIMKCKTKDYYLGKEDKKDETLTLNVCEKSEKKAEKYYISIPDKNSIPDKKNIVIKAPKKIFDIRGINLDNEKSQEEVWLHNNLQMVVNEKDDHYLLELEHKENEYNAVLYYIVLKKIKDGNGKHTINFYRDMEQTKFKNNKEQAKYYGFSIGLRNEISKEQQIAQMKQFFSEINKKDLEEK